jgi:hypothetical protein
MEQQQSIKIDPIGVIAALAGIGSIAIPCLGPVSIFLGGVALLKAKSPLGKLGGIIGIVAGLLGLLLIFASVIGIIGLQSFTLCGLSMMGGGQ